MAKKFNDIQSMVNHILRDPRLENEVILINGAAYETTFLKECAIRIAHLEVRWFIGETISSLERLGMEVLMQVFDVELVKR